MLSDVAANLLSRCLPESILARAVYDRHGAQRRRIQEMEAGVGVEGGDRGREGSGGSRERRGVRRRGRGKDTVGYRELGRHCDDLGLPRLSPGY
jgi:hypothetical protein